MEEEIALPRAFYRLTPVFLVAARQGQDLLTQSPVMALERPGFEAGPGFSSRSGDAFGLR